MLFKKAYLLLLSFLITAMHSAYAQDSLRYVNAATLAIGGKAKKTADRYQRIDKAETTGMTKDVQGLAKNSSGIYIVFETNSTVIAAKWKLTEDKYMAFMTPIAHSGLDLYCWINKKWQYVSVGKPVKSTTKQSQVIIQRLDTTKKRFMLYLPLYNTITELEIGVDKSALIQIPEKLGIDDAKRVVVYGSSIVQGASASRPGMAYPAIIQRQLGMEVINLGFSGSAKMEIEVAKYLATVPSDCFVLDCIPNQTPEQVSERALPFIKYLRSQRPKTPIIIVESVVRETSYFDHQLGNYVRRQNENIKKSFTQLKKEKYRNIYYISAEKFMGKDHDGTVDGTHLTDLGFSRIAEEVMKVLKKVMD